MCVTYIHITYVCNICTLHVCITYIHITCVCDIYTHYICVYDIYTHTHTHTHTISHFLYPFETGWRLGHLVAELES